MICFGIPGGRTLAVPEHNILRIEKHRFRGAEKQWDETFTVTLANGEQLNFEFEPTRLVTIAATAGRFVHWDRTFPEIVTPVFGFSIEVGVLTGRAVAVNPLPDEEVDLSEGGWLVDQRDHRHRALGPGNDWVAGLPKITYGNGTGD